ncbi:hypothetical protein [Candidatus Ruminimicrobium bovinum]|uniref:hypothetical protein n=1 Tax=Candidatus Ruminimicrobium bovinum TaxID=3242779 RepID=UPI0039B9C162
MKKIYFDDSILLSLKKRESFFDELKNLVDKKKIQIFINPIDDTQFKNLLINQIDLLKIKRLNTPSYVLTKKFLNFINWQNFNCSEKEIFIYEKNCWEYNKDIYSDGYKLLYFCLKIFENYLIRNIDVYDKEIVAKITNKDNVSREKICVLLSRIHKISKIEDIQTKEYLIRNISYYLFKNNIPIKEPMEIEYLKDFYNKNKYIEFIANFIIKVLNEMITTNSLMLFSLFDTEQLIYSEYVDIFFYKDIDTYEFLPKENKEIYNKFKNVKNCGEIIEMLREVI